MCTACKYVDGIVRTCGDGVVTFPETCEPTRGVHCNRRADTGWSCANDICVEVCGDGLLVGGEACDDGNTTGGDGCSSDCTTQETGWICTGEPSFCCASSCGDSITAGLSTCPGATYETCDDGSGNTTSVSTTRNPFVRPATPPPVNLSRARCSTAVTGYNNPILKLAMTAIPLRNNVVTGNRPASVYEYLPAWTGTHLCLR